MNPFNKTEAFLKKRIPKLLTHHSSLFTLMLVGTLTIISGCNDKKKPKSLTEGGMKCGAGKCGASMAGGSSILIKKRANILRQMDTNDSRRACVLKAHSVKKLYDCVRDPISGRLVK